MILVLLLISIFSSVIGRIFLFLSKPCNFCKFFLLWQKLCMKDIQILKLMLFFPRDSSLFPQLNRKHEEQIMLIHLETEPGPCWVIALVRLSLLLTPQVCFRPLPFEEYCLLSTTRLQETLLCFFSSVHSLPQRLSTQNVSYGGTQAIVMEFLQIPIYTPTHIVIKSFSNFTSLQNSLSIYGKRVSQKCPDTINPQRDSENIWQSQLISKGFYHLQSFNLIIFASIVL